METTTVNKSKPRAVLKKRSVSVAKQRWKILANAIRGRTSEATKSVSVRRFESFGLLRTKLLTVDKSDTNCAWFKYTCPTVDPAFEVDIRQMVGPVKLEDFMGFNNTGNVCVWPSEEVLTHYCLKNINQFRNKRVCELGGGMTCLAGVAIASQVEADEILLTDGNEQSVSNLKAIIDGNTTLFKSKSVRSSLMLWDENIDLDEKDTGFDFVICADCLFFDDYRAGLAHTIHSVLRPQGTAIIFAPSRGSTFEAFTDLISSRFTFQKLVQYDDVVWQRHLEMKDKGVEEYDENIHYPQLLLMEKL